MTRFLHRLGRGAALHPWRTLGAWVLAAGIVFGLASAYGGTPVDNWDVPGAPAQRGVDQLRAHVPGAGNASAQVVVHGEAGQRPSAGQLDALTGELLAMDHAVAVTPPRLSDDGDTALLVVSYDEPVTHPDLYENLEPLEDAVADTRDAGLQVEFGGELPEHRRRPDGRLRRADRHRRRAAHPAARVRLRRRCRTADRGGPGRAGGRLRRAHAAGRDHGRQHRRPDGRQHGRSRRRHRLRAAAGHAARGVPPSGPRRARGGRTRRGHRRTLGGLRLRDRAGVPDGSPPGRAVDVLLVRLRHRHRRGHRGARRTDPGAGVRPVRRAPAAAPQGAPRP